MNKQKKTRMIKIFAYFTKKAIPFELLQDGVDATSDYLIETLHEKVSVNEILNDSKLAELGIDISSYDFVRENIELMLDKCDFNDFMLRQYGFNIPKMAIGIFEQYAPKEDYSDIEMGAILKGMQIFLSEAISIFLENKSFIWQCFESISKTQEENKRELERKLEKAFEEIKREIQPVVSSSGLLTDAWSNLSAWWLLSGRNVNQYGFVNDRYSIKLFTLLLGMTDPYNIIIASNRPKGLCAGLNQVLNDYRNKNQVVLDIIKDGRWSEFDDRFPDALRDNLPSKTMGVVLNLYADDSCPINSLVLNAIEKKKNENVDLPMVINIWFKNPSKALSVLQDIKNYNACSVNAEYLSVIPCDALCINESTIDAPEPFCHDRMSLKECERELINLYNKEPCKWWRTIEWLARSNDINDNLLGFLAARPIHNAVQMWLSNISGDIISQIINSDSLSQMLSSEDKNYLYFAVYYKFKICDPQNKSTWKSIQTDLEDFCSKSAVIFLSMDNNRDGEQNNLTLDNFTIANWARFVPQETFESMLPYIKQENLTFFWIALVNSEHGISHILNMRDDQKKRNILSAIINQTETNFNNDFYLEMDTIPIRDSIRSYKMI